MKKEQDKIGIVNGPIALNMMSDQKDKKLNFGQAIIFNPFLLHGNRVFNSELARIVTSTRFQSSNYTFIALYNLLLEASKYLPFLFDKNITTDIHIERFLIPANGQNVIMISNFNKK